MQTTVTKCDVCATALGTIHDANGNPMAEPVYGITINGPSLHLCGRCNADATKRAAFKALAQAQVDAAFDGECTKLEANYAGYIAFKAATKQ